MKSDFKPVFWALLVAGVAALFFLPVLQGEFLYWDDGGLFVHNPYYRGLSPVHWQWMCTTFFFGHWQPLSWLSCALDYTTWGMNPQGWHATNLLLHTGNAVLVYLLCLAFLKEKRNGRYAVAVLAALFWAIHPLRVEGVAWLATRGYLLCTTFCLLTLLFYLRAVEQKRYPLAALLCFTLATFTKGIGMMLPLVLLLVDWFPLRRITCIRTAFSRAAEKIPFFALSLLAGAAAFLAKKTDGGMMPIEQSGLAERLGQAVYGSWFYLLKTAWPLNLSPLYYKRPDAGPVMTALVLTAAAAIFLFLFRNRLRPVITVLGAFLLLIFPMLGLTQSGAQLFADRFTYLATIPFSVLLAAGLIRLRALRRPVLGAALALLIVSGAQTFVFSNTWSHNLTLWWRAVSVDKNNALAYNCAGRALMDYQQYEKALECFERAVQLNPAYTLARHNRALALAMMGRYGEAFSGWEIALSMPEIPRETRAKIRLVRGWAFEQAGDLKAAENDFSSVADDYGSDPAQRADALQVRAMLFARTGQKEKARIDLATILKLPDLFGNQQQRASAVIGEIDKTGTD
jgi:tetratricopeptide (TPR) repeat protein